MLTAAMCSLPLTVPAADEAKQIGFFRPSSIHLHLLPALPFRCCNIRPCADDVHDPVFSMKNNREDP